MPACGSSGCDRRRRSRSCSGRTAGCSMRTMARARTSRAHRRCRSATCENWRDAVTRARDWSKAHAIAFVFVIAPDKHVDLPRAASRLGPPRRHVARADQVFAALAGSGAARRLRPAARASVAIDLRPALFDAKTRERVYHLTDTHWNERGAFVAYRQIIDALHAQKPAVPPAWPRSDFNDRSDGRRCRRSRENAGARRVCCERSVCSSSRSVRVWRVWSSPPAPRRPPRKAAS